tara:strand:+ start:1375 stop:1860 length:486 start_codon:yes stop_codon:yes gene_type:complete
MHQNIMIFHPGHQNIMVCLRSHQDTPSLRTSHGLYELSIMRERLVTIRKSPIHGNGIFALRPIRKHSVVTYYDGEYIDWETALTRTDKTYMRTVSYGHLVIDGLRVRVRGMGLGSLCNHKSTPNAKFVVRNDTVYVKALSHIAENEEVTVNYGPYFWKFCV